MKKVLTVLFISFVSFLAYSPVKAEESLTVSKLLNSPQKYEGKTVKVMGYMANVNVIMGRYGFALFDKKAPSALAYDKPVIEVDTMNMQQIDQRRLSMWWMTIRDGRASDWEKGQEGLVTVEGILKQRNDFRGLKEYYIETVKFPTVAKSGKKKEEKRKKATVAELNRLDMQSRGGKLVNKGDDFNKSYYQDRDGKIWYREDWENKEIIVTGYMRIDGELCENEGQGETEDGIVPCIDINRSTGDPGINIRQKFADALSQQGISPDDEVANVFLNGKHARVRVVIQLPQRLYSQWIDFKLKEIKFLFLSQKGK